MPQGRSRELHGRNLALRARSRHAHGRSGSCASGAVSHTAGAEEARACPARQGAGSSTGGSRPDLLNLCWQQRPHAGDGRCA
eukprot:7275454-Lingulodinium_polyedra.AAC.1